MFVACRKRVVHLPNGGEIDFGCWDLRDFVQPGCYAARQLESMAMQEYTNSREVYDPYVQAWGIVPTLTKIMWNTVNKAIGYRHDDPVFQTPDFWMLPNETWHMKAGDCEDSTLLLASAVELAKEMFGGFDPAESTVFAVLGYYNAGDALYGHAYVLFRNPKIVDRWLWIETTWDEEVPINVWYVWDPNKLIPVYFGNSRVFYRIDQHYDVLGLSKSYVDQWWDAIQAMIEYVESGRWLKNRWMHKKIRPVPKPVGGVVIR